jgi:Lrp/AsnC family leucine-responsive transcriptional regulator
MDEKDEAIIRVLERKAKLSNRSLSKLVGLPISTVHRRIQKLEQEGVIVGYKALIDYEKTNKPISVLLLINLAEVIPGKGHIPKKEIIKSLEKFEEIEEIIEVQTFSFDLVVKARMQSLRRLSAMIEELRSMEGIEETSSAIITEEIVLPPPILFKKSTKFTVKL